MIVARTEPEYTATRNACKLCAPLGAALVFKGIRDGVPLLHGSQGCSTYIRRYLISHFKEPVDIACSNFAEQTAIFGGGVNLKVALSNIRTQYDPAFIGVATTCLSETIGDNVDLFIREFRESHAGQELPPIAHVSTPSYQGTHMEGFHGAVLAVVSQLAGEGRGEGDSINLFPGMLSPADLRHLREIMSDFGVPATLLPDYSRTLDGPLWREYRRIPEGGTPVSEIRRMGFARGSLELGRILAGRKSAGKLLEERNGVPCRSVGLPVGIGETDRFMDALAERTGRPVPLKYREERGRLVDAYADGHKYLMEKRAVVYGEEDLVVGMAAFLDEIGVIPVLCATGGRSGLLSACLAQVIPDMAEKGIEVREDIDFLGLESLARHLSPDLLIGSSKGYSVARKLDVPMVRIGFPIHDRVGGARILHVGYRGAQVLFDTVANTLIRRRQESSPIGYAYM